MKNRFFFFLYILLLVTAGCNPDPIVEETHDIEVICDSNGTVSPTRLIVYKGETAKISITPFKGCVVKSIQVEGHYVSVPENNILILENVNSDMKVVVNIEKVQEYYKVNATSSIGGAITPSGEMTVPKGTARTFALASNSNYFIDSLLIDEKNMDIPANASTYSFSYIANDTLRHTIRVVYREKKVYTITTICDEYSTFSGTTSVYEGSSSTLKALAKSLCSLVSVKVDGVAINGNSYTFSNVNSDHTFEVSSKREAEWFLCRGTWVKDSSYINNTRYIDGGNIKLIYYSSGVVSYTLSSGITNNSTWNINKNVSPMTITQLSSSAQQIILLDENKMILYFEGKNADGEFIKATEFYHNTKTR